MRILLILLWAAVAGAQTTTDHLILPSYGGSHNFVCPATNNQLLCWRIPARLGITGATKMAVGINAGGSAGCVYGVAVYPDSDGGTVLGSLSQTCTSAGVKTQTVSAFSLVQGTTYRFCQCSTKANCTYTGLYGFEPTAQNKAAILNANPLDLRAFVATNPCVLGVPPSTTGASVSAATTMPPILLLETP